MIELESESPRQKFIFFKREQEKISYINKFECYFIISFVLLAGMIILGDTPIKTRAITEEGKQFILISKDGVSSIVEEFSSNIDNVKYLGSNQITEFPQIISEPIIQEIDVSLNKKMELQSLKLENQILEEKLKNKELLKKLSSN